jgi:hypothetical protein
VNGGLEMNIKIINFSEAEQDYRKFLKRQYKSLAQHSWAWQRVLAEWPGHTWKLLALCDYSNNIIGCIPFCQKQTELGKVIMSSPLSASYGGVLHIEECDWHDVYKILLHELMEYAQSEKVDIISIFSSPFRDDVKYYRDYFKPTYEMAKFYQYIPNVNSIDECGNSKFRNNVRRSVRKVEESGFMLQHSTDSSLVSQWYDVVTERFCDIKAVPVAQDFYVAIMKYLGEEGLAELLYVTTPQGIIGGGIFLYGWCQDIYLRVATTPMLTSGVSTYLDYQGLLRGIEKDVNAHNFQSSPSKDSATYQYKQSWGCLEENNYYFVKVIGDEKKFLKAGKTMTSDSFPYYFVLPYSIYE